MLALRVATKYHTHSWGNDFPAHGREFYQKHNEWVRTRAKHRPFLEYDAKTGWRPLCEFLGLDVPLPDAGIGMPRSDDWAEYKKRVGKKQGVQQAQTD